MPKVETPYILNEIDVLPALQINISNYKNMRITESSSLIISQIKEHSESKKPNHNLTLKL